LQQAASCRDPSLVETLVAHGADAGACTKRAKTALHSAADSNNLPVARFLISAGGGRPCARHTDAPLHIAARRGYDEMVRLLLESGADPNVTDERDKTPLHFAAQEGNIGALQVLLAGGARLNARDRAGNTPLHDASVTGHLDVVKELMSAGADVNVQDDRGRTALHEAARTGRIELADYLVHAGARADIQDRLGQTPLGTAQASNQWGVAKLLMSYCGEGARCGGSATEDVTTSRHLNRILRQEATPPAVLMEPSPRKA
jgi:cytohesin